MSEVSSDVLSSTVFDWDEDVRLQEERDIKEQRSVERDATPARGTFSEALVSGWGNRSTSSKPALTPLKVSK